MKNHKHYGQYFLLIIIFIFTNFIIIDPYLRNWNLYKYLNKNHKSFNLSREMLKWNCKQFFQFRVQFLMQKYWYKVILFIFILNLQSNIEIKWFICFKLWFFQVYLTENVILILIIFINICNGNYYCLYISVFWKWK